MSKVIYEKKDKIAYVTLNRPKAMNAIDLDMHNLLWQTWADFRDAAAQPPDRAVGTYRGGSVSPGRARVKRLSTEV